MLRALSTVVASMAVVATGLLAPAGAVGSTGSTASTAQTLPGELPEPPMSAVARPNWQTDGSVWSLAVGNGWVYAGGVFGKVRPPKVAVGGAGEVTQPFFARFNQATGAFDARYRPQVNGRVYAATMSPDKTRLYIGGDFTSVNGQRRNRIAALDARTGALISTWKPSVSYRVRTISATATTVYFGGSFGLVNNQARPRLAAVNAITGALLPWNPQADNDVYVVGATASGAYVFTGGPYNNMKGAGTTNIPQHRSSRLSGTTGAVLPFAAASATPRDNFTTRPFCRSRPWALTVVGQTAYFGNAGDGTGCYDGTWAADVNTGRLKWNNSCLGATMTLTMVNGWLFKGSHAHDCSASGSFPQSGNHMLLFQDVTNGRISGWHPNTNATLPTRVGPLASATGGTDLWVGGDFTTVNGAPQQGLVHFTNAEPSAVPPRARTPKLTAAAGRVTISHPATVDDDNEYLTYTLYRYIDGSNTKWFPRVKVAQKRVRSTFWIKPTVSFVDTPPNMPTTLPPGSHFYSYRVEVTDGVHTDLSNFSAKLPHA